MIQYNGSLEYAYQHLHEKSKQLSNIIATHLTEMFGQINLAGIRISRILQKILILN